METAPNIDTMSCSCRPVDITALIVDHALRDESSQEAERAVELANALGLQPMMMRVDWRRKHPKQGQMLEAARNARYELMLDACRRLGARTLLTAHHAGVLAWVVMRLWPPKGM